MGSEEQRIALASALVNFSGNEPAIGIDHAMDPHGGSGQEHDMQALLAVNSGKGLPEQENIPEHKGFYELAGVVVLDLSINLGFGVTREIKNPEFPGMVGASRDADFLCPVGHSPTLVKEHPIRGGSIRGIARGMNYCCDRKIPRLAELEMLPEIHLPGQSLAGTDFQCAENSVSSRVYHSSSAVADDEIQPLVTAVAAEHELLARVIGDGYNGDYLFTGQVLILVNS